MTAQANTFVPAANPPAMTCVPVNPASSFGFALFGARENLSTFAERREARMAIACGENGFNERNTPIPGFPGQSLQHVSRGQHICAFVTDVGQGSNQIKWELLLNRGPRWTHP